MRVPGLLAPLLGLGLGLALSGPGAAQHCGALGPVEPLAFTPAARARWLAPRVRVPGPLDPLYGTVRRFLGTVQLNPFPSELVKRLLKEPSSVKAGEVVRYEAGYVACAVIAGLYLLAVPTAGLCFCCGRWRRRCGGRVKTQHKTMACERGTLMAFLLLTTLVLLVGVACAFATNQRTHDHMGPSVAAVPETLLSLQAMVSDVLEELQAVAQEFSLPQERVLKELDGVGEHIGNTIHSQLGSTVYLALATVHSLGGALQVSVDSLRALNSTSAELRARQRQLEPAVWGHRERLLALLQEPQHREAFEGALGQARALELAANFSQMPRVDSVLHRLKGVPEANFSSLVEEENSTFNSLPLLVAMQMDSVLKDLKKAVTQLPEGVGTMAEGFPGLEAAFRWSQALESLEQDSRPYLREAQRYERYRWILGCVLCSAVLLVVACNLLGLSLGVWGLSAREDPGHAEAQGEAGARVLMLGVACSFLLAVPLILLVFSTFLVGGNVQTLVCQGWASGELLEFADTPGNLPPCMDPARLLGLRKNISIRLAYQQCREGATLWNVLQLNDSYNLEKHLNISQYTLQLQREAQSFKLDLSDLDLLSPEARRDLEALRSSGLEDIRFQDFLLQIEKPVVRTSVEQLAQELEALAQGGSNSSWSQQLQEEAQELRNLYWDQVVPQQGLVAKLNVSVRALQASAPRLQLEASEVLANVTDLKGELPAWAGRILRNESECILTREMGYFSQYVAWVREEVTQCIATCQPLSGALDNSRVILCDMVADPWNAFWFCLAWCAFFLIPSIIFAVKTSKYFRPIRKRLSSTSSEETRLFHIPRVTSLKL